MKLYVWLLLLTAFRTVNAFGYTNFFVKSIQHCDPNASYTFTFNITLRNVGNEQFMDSDSIFLLPLDNTLPSVTYIQKKTTMGHGYVDIFEIKEKKSCDAFHKYLGEFLYDIERAAGLISRMCPIPKGKYIVRGLQLHYEKIALQTFPFGNLRFTIIIRDNKNNKNLTCLIVEVDNRAN